ncbi:MAG: DUF5916 domain-containing protein, partial [Acidobacteriota bacterium]
RILYDERNLYVAIRAHDTEAELIETRVTRRDDRQGDQVAIYIDSYFDQRSAFAFNVSSAGVKTDLFVSDDGENEDESWDAVWYVGVQRDGEGWTAEMAIPLSQLRFSIQEEPVWGIQVWRWLHRKEELSGWQFIPKEAPGMVYWYGELRGLAGIEPHRQVEIVPYTVAQMERFEKEDGNPFATGRSRSLAAGLDGKIGITNDLTMTFTVNPDFGQVEADPSEVNLTTFETFFAEKRPFFIEGRNILDFRLMGGDGDFSQDNLFYSRRIGRRPRHELETDDDEHVNMPDNTSIVGAWKLTGKTRSGLSVGILESVTSQEYAQIDHLGEGRLETVEPLANYFVGRIQKDFHRGDTIVGGMFTATNRSLDNQETDIWHRAAYTGGFDFRQGFRNRNYVLSVKGIFSNVRGDAGTILKAQESSVRYFQRPDGEHVSVDPTRTSLSGHGGTVDFGKEGSGHIRFSTGVTWRSPGLELNDVGFLRTADRILQWSWLGYRVWEPFSIFRSLNVNVNQWRGWDFGGTNLFDGGNINGSLQFKNYWSVGAGINRQGESLSTNELRGGPALALPGGWGSWFNIRSDNRKALRFNVGGWNFWGDGRSRRTRNFWFGATYRPRDALSISFRPSVSRNNRELQYVGTEEFGTGERYLFGNIRRTTLAMTFRLSYSVTPNLSIQYYGQPFLSSGDYFGFKRITSPRAGAFEERFQPFSEDEIRFDSGEGEYLVDENRDGVADYRFDDPDFNFREFRSNLVIRWEYSPGSTLFVVWSQQRAGDGETGVFSFGDDVNALFRVHPHNVFLVKFSRRFAL